MAPLSRLAFIGNSLPRRCGIATFTTDLQQATAAWRPKLKTSIVAMTDQGQDYDYPSSDPAADPGRERGSEDYVRAADFSHVKPIRCGLPFPTRVRYFRRRVPAAGILWPCSPAF